MPSLRRRPRQASRQLICSISLETCCGTARTDTGNTSSAAAFQSAFIAACGAGGSVTVPYGIYSINQTVAPNCTTGFYTSFMGDSYGTSITWTGGTPSLSACSITGTAGQLSCTAANIQVGSEVLAVGTAGGTGSGISGGTMYFVSSVNNGTGAITLQSNQHAALSTTVGTLTGLSYTPMSSMFYMVGWSDSLIENVSLNYNGASNLVGFDLDTNAAASSSESLTFINDIISLGTGSNTIGVRGCITLGTGGDCSFYSFVNDAVHGTGASNSIAYQDNRNNSLNWDWYGGQWTLVTTGYTNSGRPGGGEAGGGSKFFYGLGSSGVTGTDFIFSTNGSYGIHNGRFENGQRFVTVGAGGNTFDVSLNIDGTYVVGYTPSDNILLYTHTSVDLNLLGNHWTNTYGGADYTAAMISIDNGTAGNFNSVNIRNNIFQAADPYYSVISTGGVTRLKTEGNQRETFENVTDSGLYEDVIVDTMPTVTSGGGTAPTFTGTNAYSFILNEGTGSPGTSLVLGMPTSTAGWNCGAPIDQSSTTITARQTANTATSVTITFSAAPAASDKILFNCSGLGGAQ